MIAKIVAAKGGGDFARLGRYITDTKKDSLTTAAERLVLYVTDAAHDGEKVAWSRVTNCGSDDPRMAMLQIRNTQARNTRATNKTLHLVVSFPAGERPSDAQLHQIEDTLCAALGMPDHQRLSALHTNTDHVHLHVALNRIHPETFRCVDPSFGQRKLMAACHQLEIALGLTRTNHGLGRDDASQAPVQGCAADMEAYSGVESFGRWVRDHARDDLLLLDLVNATTGQPVALNGAAASTGSGRTKTVSEYLAQADQELTDRYEALKAWLLALGDDVQLKVVKNYFAFRRMKNFACVEVHTKTRNVLVYVKVDPGTIDLRPGFTRDVRNIGHFGTGELEITIHTMDDLERAKPLLEKKLRGVVGLLSLTTSPKGVFW